MCPTLCPNRLSAEYQSPRGAQETGASGPAEEGPWEHPRLPDGDAGGLPPGVRGKVGDSC